MARFYIVLAKVEAEQAGKPATLRRSIYADTGPTDAEYEAAVLGEDLDDDDP